MKMALCELYFKEQKYELCYELCNLKAEKNILILHGWGANKNLMKQAFEKELKNYQCLYLDLPGFGKSSIAQSLDSFAYSELIKAFLKKIDFSPHCLLGHSFGGKIAMLLSLENLDFKNNLKQKPLLVLLSSSGIIWKKSLKIKLKIALFKILKKLGFKGFYKIFASKDAKKLSPLMYESFKKIVDENMSEFYAQTKAKSLIFWGKKDKATPLKSGYLIHKLIKQSSLFLMEGEHFFFLSNAAFIAEKIKENLE